MKAPSNLLLLVESFDMHELMLLHNHNTDAL